MVQLYKMEENGNFIPLLLINNLQLLQTVGLMNRYKNTMTSHFLCKSA